MTRKLDSSRLLWGRAVLYALITGFALAVQFAMPGSYGNLTMPERMGQLVQGSGVVYLVLSLALVVYYQRLLPLARPFLPSNKSRPPTQTASVRTTASSTFHQVPVPFFRFSAPESSCSRSRLPASCSILTASFPWNLIALLYIISYSLGSFLKKRDAEKIPRPAVCQ